MPGSGEALRDERRSAAIRTFEPIKDISQIQRRSRRFNDYTTIPRRPRHHGDCALKRGPDDHVTAIPTDDSKPSRDEDGGDGVGRKAACSGSVTHDRKDKTWSIRKLRNVFRTLKVDTNAEKKQPAPTQSGSRDTSPYTTSGSGVSRVDSGNLDADGIYADIDSVRQSLGAKDYSDTASCRSDLSGSESGMALTIPAYRPTPGFGDEKADSSQRGAVLKTLSSLSIRNINNRKKSGRKHDFEAKYRGSFKDSVLATGRRLANTDCKRCRSATISVSGSARGGVATSVAAQKTGSDVSYKDCDGGDDHVTYSLAKADDVPPPLPERTYLKLRRAASKENHSPGSDLSKRSNLYEQRNVTFPVRGEDCGAYKPAAYPRTIPEHVKLRSDWPSDPPASRRQIQTRSTSWNCQRRAENETGASSSSSGCGSASSHAITSVPDPPPATSGPVPIPVRTAPTRSRHSPACSPTTTCIASFRSRDKKSADRQRAHPCDTTSGTARRSDPDKSGEAAVPHGLTPSVIHNLPLPPGPGGAQLVRTLHLDSILKNRWISGIAVTKKNEYIVVDQREAYLLDEEGALKKVIGAKGSCRLIEPFDVAVSPSNGNLVICDHAEQDVKVFTWKGQFVRRVTDRSLTNIAGVAVTESRDIVIAGTDRRRVSVVSEEGALLYTIPAEAAADGGGRARARAPFEHPYSVAVNPLTSDVIIGDDYKQIVTAVSAGRGDDETRVLWRYCPGPGDRHFFPSAICADGNGYIFIADLYNEKVYMLDSSGKYVKTLLSRGDGLRGGPGALATDGRGHLLVADEEKTIKVFKYRDDNGFVVAKRYSYCP